MSVAENPMIHIADGDQKRAAFRNFVEQAFDDRSPNHDHAAQSIHEMVMVLRQPTYEAQLAGMNCNPAAGRRILSLAHQYLCDVQAQVFLDRPDLAEQQRGYERN